MAEFGENFRAGMDITLCPLCLEGVDSQEHSFQCKKITDILKIKTNISDVYSNTINKETSKAVTDILEIRERLLSQSTTIT